MENLISRARKKFHNALIDNSILSINQKGIPSNADAASKLSRCIALNIARDLHADKGEKTKGQTLGANFEEICRQFIADTFLNLGHLRPGKWHVERLGNRNIIKTSSFVQYAYLNYLRQLTKDDPHIATCIGNDYMITPDIVIYREPEEDETINKFEDIVDPSTCNLTVLRKQCNKLPILHASISAKWTMRSDRAQNSRAEALGLIRNRKGHLPHIVGITAEPLPSRLASLALGTGDIDCLYHIALYELESAVKEIGAEDSIEMLDILISGKRLKDISDLPLDLSI